MLEPGIPDSKSDQQIIPVIAESKQNQYDGDKKIVNPTYKELLCSLKYFKPFRLGILFCFSLQGSGINFITFYSTYIFEKLVSKETAKIYTLITGINEFVSVLIMLLLIDRVGRKTLTLIGSGGMALSLAFCALSDYYLSSSIEAINVGINFFIFFFVVSVGNITFVYLSEILTDRLLGICICINWFFVFIVAMFTVMLIDAVGFAGIMWIGTFISISTGIYFYFDMIETKGVERNVILEIFYK